MLLELMRRAAGGDEMDFIEIEPAISGARNAKVAAMNRVERTAK